MSDFPASHVDFLVASPKKHVVKDGTVSFLPATTGDFFAKHTWPCPPDGKNNIFKLFRHQLHSLKLTVRTCQKETIFQPSIFRCELAVSFREGKVHLDLMLSFDILLPIKLTYHIGGLPVNIQENQIILFPHWCAILFPRAPKNPHPAIHQWSFLVPLICGRW